MSTQHVSQEPKRIVKHKHCRVGEWLICVNTEREIYDAVFIRRGDDLLVVYPTSYVKDVLGNLSPKAELDAIDDELLYNIIGENGAIIGIGSFSSPYRTWVSPKDARLIRKQMSRVSSTEECHEFVNDLMCLVFGVCQEVVADG
jgi:hypothetical protein